jgi:recombination protein RecT
MTGKQLTPIQDFSHSLANMKKQFESLLPKTVPADRFMRTAVMAIENNPSLLEKCDRASLYTACKLAAQDGLVIDGREAAVVPFKGQAKYMPMVTGIIKRARNSGDIASITPAIVYENDEFSIDYGAEQPLVHKMFMGGDRGKAIGAHCVVRYKGGGMDFEWMTEDEIMEVKKCSKQQTSLQWTTFWTEGWKKTVIRRLFKRVPMSSELDRVITSVDDDYSFDQPEAAPTSEPAGPTTATSTVEDYVDAECEEVGEDDCPI